MFLSCGKSEDTAATAPTSAVPASTHSSKALEEGKRATDGRAETTRSASADQRPGPAPHPPTADSTPRPLTTAQIVARVDPSVAIIRGKRSLGTGFLVLPGLLATNAHVIEGEVIKNLEVRFPSASEGQKGPLGAELAFRDPKRDLALLRVKTDLPPLDVAESYKYQKGDDLLVIGNPGMGGKLVLENAINRGVMSTKTTIEGQPFYQLGIAINPGNSGGPVIDMSAKVIGVATRKASQLDETAFCIPVEDLRAAMARVEEKPDATVTGATPKPASGIDLRYGWKPGETYVYSVHVSYEVGKNVVTLDGSSLYKVKSSDQSGVSLTHRGWLITRKRTKDQSSGSDVNMPGGPTTTEVKMNPHGDITGAKGALPLPLLGDLSLLLIEPLPEEKLAQWDDVQTVSLLETRSSGGGATPFRFGRPSLAERIRGPRLGGRLQSRIGAGPRMGGGPRLGAGSRIGARRGLRGGVRQAPAPAPRETKVIAHPAQERSEYALGATSGKTVSISKTYELKSTETVGDEPSLLITGQGTFTFDTVAGIPVGLEFKAKVVENSESVTLRVPIQVSCKLLEGTEREKALRFPVLPPTALNPLSDSDLTETLADLKSLDNGRRSRAANRLRDAAPVQNRRPEVVQALQALLTDRDGSVRNAAIQAIGVWGDASSAPLLLEHLNDDHYGSRGELFEALARIEPDERIARAMLPWLAKDAGQASRVLRAMGSAAEPSLLEFVASDARPESRVEACRLLKEVGTSRSLPELKELASKRDSEELGRAAGDVARRIRERYLKGAELTAVLEGLSSTDVNRRRDAARRLLSATPIEARRDEVSRVLVSRLSEPDNETQRLVIQTLGSWGGPDAAPALANRLKDPSFLPWRETIETLGKIGHDQASAAAIARWIKQDRGVVLRALEAIGPPAEPTAIALVKSEQDWSTRSEVCKLLGTIGSQTCFPTLQEATKNKKDGFVVMAAQASLKKLQGARMTDAEVQATLDRLKSTDPSQRREAAHGLAGAGVDPAHRAAIAKGLAEALADREDSVQREALGALRVWGDRSSAKVLAERCKDKQWNPWRDGLTILAQLDPGPRTAEVMIERMPEDSGHVTRLLHELGPAAEPAILQAIQRAPDPRVRVESCRVLESIGTEACLPVLQAAAARMGEGQVGSAAEDALHGIAERE
ncbi:MAG: HEAT repeat domain-containing protein [Isosphaeraceae bacterium]